MDSNQNFKKIIQVMVSQASFFLKDMGEFYPYSYILNITEEIKPLVVKIEDDNPKSQILIEILEKQIIDGILRGDYIMGSIGVNVYLNLENDDYTNAIEIKTLERKQVDWGYVYLPYTINDKNIQFGELTSF
jgi:hypothetical protein